MSPPGVSYASNVAVGKSLGHASSATREALPAGVDAHDAGGLRPIVVERLFRQPWADGHDDRPDR